MKPADADLLQQRFGDLQDRHRAQSTFVQFLEGIRQVFHFDSEALLDLSDPAPFRRLLDLASTRLQNPSTPRLRSRLDEIEELLSDNAAALLREDSKVAPSIQRQFFGHVAGYDKGTIERLLAFYLEERDPRDWEAPELDRVDFLGTRLVEDSAVRHGSPDWVEIRSTCRSLAQVRAHHWGPAERITESDRRLLPELQKTPAEAQESDAMTEIVGRFRQFKHRLGLRLMHPDIWPEILRANWQIKGAVKRVLQREERLVLADVERVFEIEARIVPPPPLVTELAGLRQQIESFEESVQAESIRLEEFGGLRRGLATALRHLEAADLASRAGVAVGGGEQGDRQAEKEILEGHIGTLHGTVFAGDFRRFLAALAAADIGGEPEDTIAHPALIPFDVEPFEVVAFRHLRINGPRTEMSHRLVLEGAAVRQKLRARSRELRLTGRDDPSRKASVEEARTVLSASGRFLSTFAGTTGAPLECGDQRAAEQLETTRRAIEKVRSELWLLVQVGV